MKKTSTSTKNTWLIYKFEYNDRQYSCAYMLVLTMGRNKVRSIIAKGSKKVIIEMIKPTICGVRKAKVGKQGSFNRNTHKVTAFKKVLRMMRRGLGNKKDEVIREELAILVPLKYEDGIMEGGGSVRFLKFRRRNCEKDIHCEFLLYSQHDLCVF